MGKRTKLGYIIPILIKEKLSSYTVERKKISSRLMWGKVKIITDKWVSLSGYGCVVRRWIDLPCGTISARGRETRE